jgi:hypothetical protein
MCVEIALLIARRSPIDIASVLHRDIVVLSLGDVLEANIPSACSLRILAN